jgi:membrane-associated phospholipid phosphatase
MASKLFALFRENRLYLICVFAFWMMLLVYVSLTSKANGFLLLNGIHNKFLDVLFINVTLLGDGVFSILLFLCLLYYYRTELAFRIIIAYAASGIIAQVLKRILNQPRPYAYFKDSDLMILTDGVVYHSSLGFPSGHTASAFAAATIISMFNQKNKQLNILVFCLAILAGYSRVYLGQHFPEDVLAGSFIGTLSAFIITAISPVYNYNNLSTGSSSFPFLNSYK